MKILVDFKNHFLDTNIILAIILPNDESFYESNKYFEYSNHNKFFSNNAFKEAKGVINRFRKITLKILLHIDDYLSNNLINLNNVSIHLTKLKNEILKKYDQIEFPFGIKNEKFNNCVIKFIDNQKIIISEILVDDDSLKLNDLKNDVIVSFKKLNQDLRNFIVNLNCISFTESGNYVKKLLEIDDIHENDAILIDESFHLSKMINNPLAFITFDNGILNSYDEILEILSSNVYIFKPTHFVDN